MTPDATAIYYTFSTIAQALAALVGILAALAITRLSDLAARLLDELPAFSGHCQYGEAFYACIAARDFAGAIEQVEEGGFDATEMLLFHVCRETVAERTELSSTLQRALVSSGLVIAMSVACLPFANGISRSPLVTWLVLALGVALFCAVLAVAAGLALPRRRRPRRVVGVRATQK